LKEQLVIQKLLGKGNSAKVHFCVRKSYLGLEAQPMENYALKTINKSFLKQSAQNTVSKISSNISHW